MRKGRLVELIVSEMHRLPGVKVETRVYLWGAASKRKREIDVLVTGSVAGYPARLAFECKNYGRFIHAPDIDNFVGKLQDVGIPAPYGIYVSTRGFSRGAIDRAKSIGIQTLLVTGLAASRLTAAVYDAVQSIVLLLPCVSQWRVINDVKEPRQEELFSFRNATGAIVGTVADLIVKAWRDGTLPRAAGSHTVKLHVPDGWHHVFEGVEQSPRELSADIVVSASVLRRSGIAHRHDLLDGETKAVRKTLVKARFDEAAPTRFQVGWFDSENALADHLAQTQALVRATFRVLAPRIRFGPVYWPLSARLARAMEPFRADYEAGKLSDADMRAQIERLENESLDRLWDLPAE
jgi:hypothetical protein